MFKQEHFEDFILNREDHKDYYAVMEEYSSYEIFEEIIHFLDIKYPDWKTNNGIGFWAGEFVHTAILHNEYLEDREQYTFKQMCEILYDDLEYDYERCKSTFDFVYIDKLYNDFQAKYELELDANTHLNEEEYSKFYNNLFNDFQKEHLKIVTYNFEDDIII